MVDCEIPIRFANSRAVTGEFMTQSRIDKSFLLLFSKKEDLA